MGNSCVYLQHGLEEQEFNMLFDYYEGLINEEEFLMLYDVIQKILVFHTGNMIDSTYTKWKMHF